jgi:hypothetical protein
MSSTADAKKRGSPCNSESTARLPRLNEAHSGFEPCYETVVRRFAHEADTGVVLIHRGPSAQIGMQFYDAYFDWVYIDGNHLYEYVK